MVNQSLVLELSIEPATDYTILQSFQCGLDKMDEFIHAKLEVCSKIHFLNTYYVLDNRKELVALFALSNGSIILDEDNFEDIKLLNNLKLPEDEQFLTDYFYPQRFYPTTELQYIAVREDLRKNHIGTQIVKAIIEKCKSSYAGVMFISVDAYISKEYSTFPFYDKLHFTPVETECKGETRRMILPIWTTMDEALK